MAGDDSGAGEENLGVEFAMLDEALNELFGRSRRTVAEPAEIFARLEQSTSPDRPLSLPK